MLGVGGMAEVWLAENEIGKKAAVKLLLPKLCVDENIVARFQNEAKVMVQLDHPNIRQVYHYGNLDDRPCIVMEYLEGDDLKALMKQGRRFTDEELCKWWNQIADALNYTHSQGIIHRDIKPSNIFLDKRGNIKLLDFGIAKIRESISMTNTGATLGTLMYMSPEQVEDSKHLDNRSDVYSLSVSFVHLLTGKKPYDSDTMSDYAIRKGIVEQELDLSAVPSAWRAFLQPYLAKNPADRPALRPFEADASSSGGLPPFKGVPEGRGIESPLSSTGNGDLQSPLDDEGTVVTNKPQPKDKEPQPIAGASTHVRHSGLPPSKGVPEGRGIESPLSPEPKDKPKSKKGLWVSLGAVAVAALVAVLFINNKGGDAPIPAEVTAVEEQLSNGGDLTINANGVYFTMKHVQGGTFQMGSNDSEADSDEQPVHSVTVSSFYMAETEVTQALWKAVMGSNNNPSYWKGDNLPVEEVSWNDCQEFIRKLNQLTGKNFRLPTEAEWEFAARGGNKTNGYKYAGSNAIGNVAWYDGNSNQQTHPVETNLPNELGLFDMSGNVWEWCQDWYGDYSSGSQTNPQGPSSGSSRVLRGGSWGDRARSCRVSYRGYFDPGGRISGDGFRLCLPQ